MAFEYAPGKLIFGMDEPGYLLADKNSGDQSQAQVVKSPPHSRAGKINTDGISIGQYDLNQAAEEVKIASITE